MDKQPQFVFRFATGILLCALAWTSSAQAQSVEDFYSENDVKLIISSSPGGGYDTLGRLIARHLPKHIPGNPDVIAQNMPGAGGIVATTYLFSHAKQDGSVIGGIQNNAPFEKIFGNEVDYDPREFNWLGTPAVETGILLVWHEVPVDSIEDVKNKEITVASSGVHSTPSFYTRLLNEILGTKIRDVAGYSGGSEGFLAMERGEVDGYPSIFYSSLMATHADLVKNDKVKLLLQYGPRKEQEIADVPFLPDLVSDKSDSQLLKVGFAPLALGRPYLMPPNVPKERVAAMRKAFADTFSDPAFIKEAKATGLNVGSPRTGKDIQQLMQDVYDAPQKVLDRIQSIYNATGN